MTFAILFGLFAMVNILGFSYVKAETKRRRAVKHMNALHDRWVASETGAIKATRKLLIAKGTLNDIASQCAGDRCYEIWARKRAADTVALIERTS